MSEQVSCGPGYCAKHRVRTGGPTCKICASEALERLVGADRMSPPTETRPFSERVGSGPGEELERKCIPKPNIVIEPKANLRAKTSAERKAEPIHSGVLMYFPDALAAIARLSKAGNDKHNPGEPLHWSRGKSNDHMDCVTRHSLTPDAVDETGETELVAQAWRSLAALQLQQERLLAAKGVMPYSGITP